MPSIGHLAIGLAAGRATDAEPAPRRWITTAILVAVSAAPDLDVIGLLLGAPDGSAWGHRGASHSPVAVLVLIVLASGGAKRWRWPTRCGLGDGLPPWGHGTSRSRRPDR